MQGSLQRYSKLSIIVIVVMLFMPTISSVSASDAVWPMFKGNAQHTGQSQYKGSEHGLLLWNFATEGRARITSSPTIGADGTIYFGAYDTNLYALTPDGKEKWRYKAGQIIDSTPAIGPDGTIYFGSWDKNLYAIKPNGKGIWKDQAPARISSSPTIGPDGTIYIGADDGFLYAITPQGSLKWSFQTKARIFSSAALAPDGTVYVGSFDSNVYALNPDGKEKWRFPTAAVVFSSPAIGPDGTIYVGSYDNHTYAITPDGKEKWRFRADIVQASPTIASDGTIYIGSFDNNLYALIPDGKEKWRFKTDDLIVSSPVIDSEGTVYFGSVDGYLYALTPDGKEKWRFQTGGKIYSSPSIAPDGTIYVGSSDNLYAIGEPSVVPTGTKFSNSGSINEVVGYGGIELYVIKVNETLSTNATKNVNTDVILKNITTEPRTFVPTSFALKDMDGKEYAVDLTKSTFKNVKVQTNDIVRGTLNFETPSEAVVNMLTYQDIKGVSLGINLKSVKSPPDKEPTSAFTPGSNVDTKLISEKVELTILDEKFLGSDPRQYAVTVSIKNLSSGTIRYDEAYAYIKDAVGNVYTPIHGFFSGELNAGQSVTGKITFIVPRNVDSVIFVYDDVSTDSYFLVPEFPLTVGIVILVSISLMVLASKFRPLKI